MHAKKTTQSAPPRHISRPSATSLLFLIPLLAFFLSHPRPSSHSPIHPFIHPSIHLSLFLPHPNSHSPNPPKLLLGNPNLTLPSLTLSSASLLLLNGKLSYSICSVLVSLRHASTLFSLLFCFEHPAMAVGSAVHRDVVEPTWLALSR